MKLYLVADVKNHMKSLNPQIPRIELELFFNNKGIYNNFIKDVFFTTKTNKKNYISEDDLEKLALLATMKFKGNFETETLRFIEKDNDIVQMKCESYESYIQCMIEHNKSPAMTQWYKDLKEERKNNHPSNKEYSKNKGNLNIPTEDKKFVSIDFEFFSWGGKYNLSSCSEIGIAIRDRNGFRYEHYIFEDSVKEKSKNSKKLQNKFKFGNTQRIPTEKIREILEKHFEDMDYLVFHDMASDLRIFRNSKIEFNTSHVQVLDTQEMHLNYDRYDFDNKRTLKDALEFHQVPFSHLHNSGNDAAYTLNLVFKMIEKNTLKKEPSIEIESPEKLRKFKV